MKHNSMVFAAFAAVMFALSAASVHADKVKQPIIVAASTYSQGQYVLSGDNNDIYSPRVDVLFTFPKPSRSLIASSFMTAKLGGNLTTGTTYNFSIPSSCWNAYDGELRFAYRMGVNNQVAPYYYEYGQLWCDNGTGYVSIYSAGSSAVPGSDNPYGVASNVSMMFDGDWNTMNCYGPSYGLEYSPSPNYYGNQACRRGYQQQWVSASSAFGFVMTYTVRGGGR